MKDFRFYFETVGTYPTKVPCGSPATLFYPSFAVKPQLVNYLSPRQSRGSRLVLLYLCNDQMETAKIGKGSYEEVISK